MPEPTLGVLGGSGLYDLPGLEGVERLAVDTPFGPPSDQLVIGRLGGTRLVFLPRHGRGHRLLPTEINFRANIFALKQLGAEWIVSVSAVGSLREEIAPGHVVVPDQFIDRTRQRVSTFFGRGVVAHVQFADPVCPSLSRVLAEAARAEGAVVHAGGTYVCMEGPQFSTRAESHLYRSWGAQVIGMTTSRRRSSRARRRSASRPSRSPPTTIAGTRRRATWRSRTCSGCWRPTSTWRGVRSRAWRPRCPRAQIGRAHV